MKTIVVFAFFACAIILVSAVENEKCSSQSDCDADECCSRIVSFTSARCKKLKKEGEYCLDNISDLKEKDIYKFSCPCAEGLECKSTGEKNENNVLTFWDKDKCQP